MNNGFDVCTTCDRHIKGTEVVCPFCGAPHAEAPAGPLGQRPLARVSRAAWLVLGSSLTVAGCSGAIAPTASDKDAATAAAQEQTSEDASADAATADADAAAEQDAPAVVETFDSAYTYDSAYHGCYGSPPARLERLARRG
jgi:hypothetical protein